MGLAQFRGWGAAFFHWGKGALLLALLACALEWLSGMDERQVVSRLSSARVLPPPAVPHSFVDRPELGAIAAAMETGGNFLIVEGGAQVGKSVAVAAAAARLSHTRSISMGTAAPGQDADSFLRALLGLTGGSLWEGLLDLLPLSLRARDVGALLIRRALTEPLPVGGPPPGPRAACTQPAASAPCPSRSRRSLLMPARSRFCRRRCSSWSALRRFRCRR